MKRFFYVSLMFSEIGWVTKIWGVMFLVVPPKDKFADQHALVGCWCYIKSRWAKIGMRLVLPHSYLKQYG
jgi:hypothetical protein